MSKKEMKVATSSSSSSDNTAAADDTKAAATTTTTAIPTNDAAVRQLSCEDVVDSLRKVAPGNNIEADFESFPYLHHTTKEVLRSTAHLNLVYRKKIAGDVPSLSQFTLLSGPPGSEIYQESLAMALAKQFGATLLVFDPLPQPDEASLAVADRRPNPFLEMLRHIDDPPKPPRTAPPDPRGKVLLDIIQWLGQVIFEEHKLGPLVVFLSDVLVGDIEKYVATSVKLSLRLKNALDMIPAGVLVIASRVFIEKEEEEEEEEESLWPDYEEFKIMREETSKISTEQLKEFFPNEVTIGIMPEGEDVSASWNDKLERDAETLRARRNNARIRSTLRRIGWSCGDIGAICVKDRVLADGFVSRMVGYAVMHHLQREKAESISEHVLSSDSIKHGFRLLEDIVNAEKSLRKSVKDVVAENEFERKLLADVVPPNELGVAFDDIGALDDVKDTLRETVMLPLQRPELFRKGQLMKPCKGILLFGPPGTGKTMLAKAVATEAGANFINVSTSSITSKWYGEAEKYGKAVFTLASKLAPCVVFVDEVDSVLGSRESCDEHEASRRLKNVFMTNWDGLRTKDKERVVVLGATNRPFDLDEAVIRRFPKRLMVGLPDATNREKILSVILSKEELAPDVDLAAVASMTDRYSGSDLKHLCVDAAYRPIREILEKERSCVLTSTDRRKERTDICPLKMDDFRYAHERRGASTSSASATVSRLVEWNDTYGEGGSRKKQVLTYFF